MFGISDPTLGTPGIAGQFGQFDLFMSNRQIVDRVSPFSPCGRLRQAPQYFTLAFDWIDPAPTDPDFLLILTDPLLIRDPVRPFVPLVPAWAPTKFAPFPYCVYTTAHWLSNTMGNPLSTTYWDVKWYLVYSTNLTQEFNGVTFDDPLVVGDINIATIDADTGPTGGWNLYLVKRVLTQNIPPGVSVTFVGFTSILGGITLTWPVEDPPITVEHHVYGSWQLADPIFNPTVATQWQLSGGTLSFPNHTLTLRPLQA